MISSRVCMISSRLWMRSIARDWMRSSRVRLNASAKGNSPGFDPRILRHSGIWEAADEAVLNKVLEKYPPCKPLISQTVTDGKTLKFNATFRLWILLHTAIILKRSPLNLSYNYVITKGLVIDEPCWCHWLLSDLHWKYTSSYPRGELVLTDHKLQSQQGNPEGVLLCKVPARTTEVSWY